MMRTFRLTVMLLFLVLATGHAQLGGTAGGFSRMGFGARGQGMGNALTAVTTGIISPYYNPALAPFQTGHVLQGSYSFLALDRRFNQVAYTQQLTLKRRGATKFKDRPDVQSIAGLSVAWINAGDANIQGYDNDGFKTRTLSVFENQFSMAFGNRFSERLSVGLNFKFYYSGLYDGVTSSGFGADLGALYSVTDELNLGLVVQELLTKYKWDTADLYGSQYGNTTENPFAGIVRLGAAYALPNALGVAAADVELYDGKTVLARVGLEIQPLEQITFRAGVERIDLSNDGIDARPMAGFTVTQPIAQFVPSISYAFILEPIAPTNTHVLTFALDL